MALPEELRSRLEAVETVLKVLGVSGNEVNAYLLLLSRGPMRAKDVAKALNLSQSKAYEALKALVTRGWVYRTGERPARYVAVPILELWSRLKGEILSRLELVERRVIPLLEAVEARSSPVYGVKIVDESRLVATARRIVLRPGAELRVALTAEPLMTEECVRLIEEASARRRVRVMLPPERSGLAERLRRSGAEVRLKGGLFGSGVVGDEVLLVVRVEGGYVGLWSDHAFFTNIASTYFDKLWEESERGS